MKQHREWKNSVRKYNKTILPSRLHDFPWSEILIHPPFPNFALIWHIEIYVKRLEWKANWSATNHSLGWSKAFQTLKVFWCAQYIKHRKSWVHTLYYITKMFTFAICTQIYSMEGGGLFMDIFYFGDTCNVMAEKKRTNAWTRWKLITWNM